MAEKSTRKSRQFSLWLSNEYLFDHTSIHHGRRDKFTHHAFAQLQNCFNFWKFSSHISRKCSDSFPRISNVCQLSRIQNPCLRNAKSIFGKISEIWIRNESTHKTDRNSRTKRWASVPASTTRTRFECHENTHETTIQLEWMVNVNITFAARNLIKWNDENVERWDKAEQSIRVMI